MQFLPSLVGNHFVPAKDKHRFRELEVGTPVALVREPDNQWDANAIRVETTDGVKLGMINKEVAVDLSPIMGNVEGTVADGHTSTYTAKVLDLLNPNKPTLLVEVTTGWEVETEVQAAPAENADDLEDIEDEFENILDDGESDEEDED